VTDPCKQALVAVFGQEKADSFPAPLLKLMEQFYGIAHKHGVTQGHEPSFDERIFQEGLERGYYEAREELMSKMEEEIQYRLEEERRWQQEAQMRKMGVIS